MQLQPLRDPFNHKNEYQTFNPRADLETTENEFSSHFKAPEALTFDLVHKYSHFSGSSHKGAVMTWDHFMMLRSHDRQRHKWIHETTRRYKRRRSSETKNNKSNLKGRMNVEVPEGADFSLTGNTDPTVAGCVAFLRTHPLAII